MQIILHFAQKKQPLDCFHSYLCVVSIFVCLFNFTWSFSPCTLLVPYLFPFHLPCSFFAPKRNNPLLSTYLSLLPLADLHPVFSKCRIGQDIHISLLFVCHDIFLCFLFSLYLFYVFLFSLYLFYVFLFIYCFFTYICTCSLLVPYLFPSLS